VLRLVLALFNALTLSTQQACLLLLYLRVGSVGLPVSVQRGSSEKVKRRGLSEISPTKLSLDSHQSEPSRHCILLELKV